MYSMRMMQRGLLAASLLAGVSVAQAAPVDPAQSLVRATFKQFNVPVSGDFKTFSGDIAFDAAKPEQAKGQLTVSTASFDLGDPMYNKEVAKPDWFDSAKHPQATLTLVSVKPAGKAFQATADLTIRGVKKTIQFPVTVTAKAGGKQEFAGKASIKRLDYKVGASGDWGDTSLVADEVVIDFRLQTR